MDPALLTSSSDVFSVVSIATANIYTKKNYQAEATQGQSRALVCEDWLVESSQLPSNEVLTVGTTRRWLSFAYLGQDLTAVLNPPLYRD